MGERAMGHVAMKRSALALVFSLMLMLVLVACGEEEYVSNEVPKGLTTFKSISGPSLPASADDFTFCSSMVSTPVFHVDGPLAVRALFFDASSEYACVEGYLLPADAARDPSTYLDVGDRFTLNDYADDETDGRTWWWSDLHGDYYVVAAGQECSWSLDVQK